MLEQSWKCSKQCCNNAATLWCAKNRRYESSPVTSPLQMTTCLNTCAGAFKRIRNGKSRATGADLKFPLRDTSWSLAVAFSTKLETPRNEESDYIIMHYWTSVSPRWLDRPRSFFAFLSTKWQPARSLKNAKGTRTIFSHLDRTSLVNNGFVTRSKWDCTVFFSRDQRGKYRAGSIGQSRPHG